MQGHLTPREVNSDNNALLKMVPSYRTVRMNRLGNAEMFSRAYSPCKDQVHWLLRLYFFTDAESYVSGAHWDSPSFTLHPTPTPTGPSQGASPGPLCDPCMGSLFHLLFHYPKFLGLSKSLSILNSKNSPTVTHVNRQLHSSCFDSVSWRNRWVLSIFNLTSWISQQGPFKIEKSQANISPIDKCNNPK